MFTTGKLFMKVILEKIILILGLPLRYLIRYEIQRYLSQDIKNIENALNRKAAESTADYVKKHMKNVDSVSSASELLTKAMGQADWADGKLLCEFGVYSGSTINHIASLTDHIVYGFDSFEGLPERWRDGFGRGSFKRNVSPKVLTNVVLIKGWFDETLPAFVKEHNEPIGFIHMDCDLYSSARTIFELLQNRIHPGCVIVFDEYFNYPSWEDGEYKAFHEFLERVKLKYEYIGYNRFNEQVAVKIKDV